MKKLFSILFVVAIMFPAAINAQTDLTESFNKNTLAVFAAEDYTTIVAKIKKEGIQLGNGDYFVQLEVSMEEGKPSTVTLGFTANSDISMQVSNSSDPDLLFLLFSNTGTIRSLIHDDQVYIAGTGDAANDQKTEEIFGVAYIFSSVVVQKFIEM